MFRLFKKYFSISIIERKILNQITVWLMFASVLARAIPLKWFSSLLGDFNTTHLTVDKAEGEENILDSKQLELILVLKKNIRRIKKILPWKVKCFEEAIAAKKVLEKYNIFSILYLGVDKNKKKELIAHAWLKVGDLFITGERGRKKHAIVGYYT